MFPASFLLATCLIFITQCGTVSCFGLLDQMLQDLWGTEDGNSTSSPDNMGCHPDYCQVTNPCDENSQCITVGCNVTICTKINFSNPSSIVNTFEHHCLNVTEKDCIDLSFCPELVNCECQPKWSGMYCRTPCDLPCVNGGCRVDSTDDSQYCNCRSSWEGQYCDQEFVSPEELERRAVEEEKKRSVRIIAGVVAGSVAFAVVIAVVISVVLWRHRVIFVMKLVYYFKRYDNDDDKLYDVYVSMTSTANAEKFVYGDLRPKLENLGFKLYLQARDCPPGQVISESILEAVEKSRCTIMIVTPDYVTNEWNRFEYLIAQHETIKLNQKIIPIILEQVDKANLDKSLKHILDSIKCLKHPMTKKSGSSENELVISSCSSWTHPQERGFPNSYNVRIAKEKQQSKTEKATEKFWKRLELILPKKKKNAIKSKESVKYDNIYVSTQNLDRKCTDVNSIEHKIVNTKDSDIYKNLNTSVQQGNKDVSYTQLNSSLLGILDETRTDSEFCIKF